MHALHKAFHVLKTGIIHDPSVLLRYTVSYITGTAPSPLSFYSAEDLSKNIIAGASVIRLGDGEVMLMMGRDIHYQEATPALTATLRTIIHSYNTQSSYILALPHEALTATDTTLKAKQRHRIWRLFRCFAAKHLTTQLPYADAHSFYHQAFLQSLLPTLLQNRHVLCVCRNVFQDAALKNYLSTYGAKVDFITCSDTNAFDDIIKIKSTIDTCLTTNHLAPLLLLAAGPTSKALAFHYQEKGIQSIDIGHGIEIVGRTLDYSNRV